jgi:lipoic acid synthetase
MLGLGERDEEVEAVLRDLRGAGVRRVAIGQYLRPDPSLLPVRDYVTPERFAAWEETARGFGFEWVKAGPFVRSSYHADDEP